jgi:hypothetical protein
MNWNHVRTHTRGMRSVLGKRWVKLTDADWHALVPRSDEFFGCIEALYGLTKREIEEELQAALSLVQKQGRFGPRAADYASIGGRGIEEGDHKRNVRHG